MRTYIASALALLVPCTAAAQGLDAFLEASQAHSTDARAAAEVRAQAQATSAQIWGSLLPSVVASGGYTHNAVPAQITLPTGTSAETIIISPENQLDATIRAEVPVIDVNRWVRTAAGSAQVDAALAREAGTLDTVRRQVLSAFFNAVGARAVLDSAKKSLTVAQAQLELNTQRFEAGVGSELDLERARAEVERNRQLVAEADVQETIAVRALESASGLAVTSTLSAPDADDLHPEPELESFERRAQGVPSVTAALSDQLAAARSTSASFVVLVPAINAFAQERLTNATGFQNRYDLFTAGLTFNWRLDLVGLEAIRAQQHAASFADIAAEKSRQAARDQIHSDWQRVRSAIERVRASQAQAKATAHAAQLAHERFSAGVATQLDVIQADRDVFAADVARTQAQLDLAFDRLALKLSAALPLEVRR